MYSETVPVANSLLATANAYYAYPEETYEMKPIEFEQIFWHALPQKSDDPAARTNDNSAADPMWENALYQNNQADYIDSFKLSQLESRPACTSVDGSCKTGTAATLDYQDVVSSHSNHGDSGIVNSVIDSFDGSTLVQMDRQSRPACTSVEGSCKNGSAAKPFTDTLPLPYENDNWGQSNEHWQPDAAGSVGKKYLVQRESVPACTSVEGSCKKESLAFPPDYAVTVPNWGNSNEHWQPTDAPSVGEKQLIQLESGSIPTCTSFECLTGTAAMPFSSEKTKKYPMDYFVPNFGQDKEGVSDAQNLADAEKKLGAWNIQEQGKEVKKDYVVPNFGVDQDIADSFASETLSADTLGHQWVIPPKEKK